MPQGTGPLGLCRAEALRNVGKDTDGGQCLGRPYVIEVRAVKMRIVPRALKRESCTRKGELVTMVVLPKLHETTFLAVVRMGTLHC